MISFTTTKSCAALRQMLAKSSFGTSVRTCVVALFNLDSFFSTCITFGDPLFAMLGNLLSRFKIDEMHFRGLDITLFGSKLNATFFFVFGGIPP